VSQARRLNHCNNTELIAGGFLRELDIFPGCVCHEPDWVTPDPALDFATAATVDVVGEWWERKRRREKNRKWERKRRRGNKILGAEDECILAKMSQRKREEEKVGEEEKINPVFLFLFYQVLLTDVYILYWMPQNITFVARLFSLKTILFFFFFLPLNNTHSNTKHMCIAVVVPL
jgi:hypothetical protein